MRPATRPTQRPADARLLVVDGGGDVRHASRAELVRHLRAGDLLVANDAATIPASLTGVHAASRAPVEIRLASRPTLDPADVYRFTAVAFGEGDFRTRTEQRPPPAALGTGDTLLLGPLRATVTDVLGHPRLVTIAFDGSPDRVWSGIALHGRPIQYAHVPEPLRMWDVWTRVAAVPAAFEPPSASFVLDWALIGRLRRRGVRFATLTHAAGVSSTGDPGLDARLPLDEAYRIPSATVDAIEVAKARGGRVVALGTTVTRALEHASSRPGGLLPGDGLATQRIGRGTRLRVVDAIVSGTHEDGESHYELLRAFAGDETLTAMSRALDEAGYRSHEFGDSVLVDARGRALSAPVPG